MPTNQTEHDFKFASWLEHTADGSQHKQSQARISVLIVLRTEETRQGAWTDVYGLCATLYFVLTGVEPPDARERR